MRRPYDEICVGIRGEILRDEPLARHTSLKVGGPADLFVTPADRDDLKTLIDKLLAAKIPHLVLGGGYNLLARDRGFRGAVISLRALDRVEELPGSRISVEAGVTNGALVRFAEERNLAGIEFLIGIPGTVGGAVAVNAGAHGEAVLDRVESLTTLREGRVLVTEKEELSFGYRHLMLAPGEIVLAITFRLNEGSAAAIEERIEGFLAHRRTAQRVGYPNAGSFFKNPPGKQAWQLIDAAGLRGFRIGGAQVAEAHANFLVNRGGATARDFIELARLIKTKVKEQSGILLEEEVRIVGED
jgi:UDP-N-acetylmuramate dehydrogenase